MGENPDGIVTADIGPDDDEGTANNATDVDANAQPAAETQPNAGTDQQATTEPTTEPTQPGPEEGEPESKDKPHTESLEDVKEARRFFQTKAQEETERRKQLEDEFTQLTTDLRESDPSKDFDPGAILEKVQESSKGESAAVVPAPADEYAGEFDPQKLRAEIVQDVLTAIDGRDRQRVQAEATRRYNAEVANVGKKFTDTVTRNKIPEEVIKAGLEYAQRYVPHQELGAPTRRVELAGEYIQREMTVRAVKAQQELATKAAADADAKKIVDAKQVAQPSGSGISAPAPTTPESINEELANDIIPDDVFD